MLKIYEIETAGEKAFVVADDCFHVGGWYRVNDVPVIYRNVLLLEECMKKNLTGNQIRQMFLDFFKSKGFMIEPSAQDRLL